VAERSGPAQAASLRNKGSGFLVLGSHRVITINLNGESHTIEGEPALMALLEKLKLSPTRIAVEINHAVVPKAEYARTILKAGDKVEIISFVGGG
jgi:sulfur carrier protein